MSLTAINNATLAAFKPINAKKANSDGNPFAMPDLGIGAPGSGDMGLGNLGLGGLDSFGLSGGGMDMGGLNSIMSGDSLQLFSFLGSSLAPTSALINSTLAGIADGSISSKAPEGEGTEGTTPPGGTGETADTGETQTVSATGNSGGTVNGQFDKNWDSTLDGVTYEEGSRAGKKIFPTASERDAFKNKVLQIASKLEMDPDHLMGIMQVESGFDPSNTNNDGSGATGLIQFMATTAKNLGTTTSALQEMSALEQLGYVEKYLMPYKGRLKTATDAYMAVFSPAFIGKGENNVAYSQGSDAYRMNSGLDLNKDGKITNGELGKKINDAVGGGNTVMA